MKSIISLLILLIIGLGASAQICTGNLGENIFEKGDFGSGTAQVLTSNPNIAPGYTYTTSVPQDGSYTICSNTSALNGLYPTWIRTSDNSDDPNGYMMVVNASYDPGIFYEEEVVGLCENTLYEFSADILNLIKAGTANHIDPNVSFLIDNVEVYSTGNIGKTEEWKQFGFSFITNSSQSSITLTLRNNAPGGSGNDLALDNISFRPCGPSSFIGIDSDTTIFLCIDDDPLTVRADIDAGDGQVFAIQWQSSQDGINWTILEDSLNSTITHTNFEPGDYYYRYYSAGNEINILNEKCRIISDEIKLTILPDTYFESDSICEGLIFNFGSQQLTSSGTYVEDFESQYGCDSVVFLDLIFVSSKEMNFDVSISDPSCFGFDDGVINVNTITGGNGGITYTFLNGDNLEINSLPSGTYIIEATDRYGCAEILDIELFDPLEVSVFIGSDTTIRLGDGLSFEPDYSTDFATVLWTGQGEFSCNDCENTSFIPYFDGPVIVSAIAENGCVAKDSLSIIIDEENFITLPNIFSPNDDGTNDFFTIQYYGRSVSSVVSFAVFDRWGGKIYSANNLEVESGGILWDGYTLSKKAEVGVYTYVLEALLVNNVKIDKIGDVTVLK